MKLAVTGLGVVSPIGTGRASFVDAYLRDDAREKAFGGDQGVVAPDVLGTARVAEVWNFDAAAHLGAKGHRNFDRLTKLQIVAAKHALEDAGIKHDGKFIALSPARVGVCSATAYGSLEEITELNRVAELEDPRYINPTRFPNTVINSAAGYVGIWEDLQAPNTTITDGNTGSLDGVLHASIHLDQSRVDAMLVGGGEVVTEPLILAMRRLGVSDLAGFNMGEGAAFVVLERAADAAARSAPILGYVLGFGGAFEAPEREAVIVHVSAEVIERAILDALRDAGVSPDSVDLVVSAAGGIERFDDAEAEAVTRVFGPGVRRIEPKRSLGESFGAAGAFGLAAALANFERDHAKRAIVIAVGFYGNASAVVVSREA